MGTNAWLCLLCVKSDESTSKPSSKSSCKNAHKTLVNTTKITKQNTNFMHYRKLPCTTTNFHALLQIVMHYNTLRCHYSISLSLIVSSFFINLIIVNGLFISLIEAICWICRNVSSSGLTEKSRDVRRIVRVGMKAWLGRRLVFGVECMSWLDV